MPGKRVYIKVKANDAEMIKNYLLQHGMYGEDTKQYHEGENCVYVVIDKGDLDQKVTQMRADCKDVDVKYILLNTDEGGEEFINSIMNPNDGKSHFDDLLALVSRGEKIAAKQSRERVAEKILFALIIALAVRLLLIIF